MRRFLVVAALALLVTAVSAGCGSSSTNGSGSGSGSSGGSSPSAIEILKKAQAVTDKTKSGTFTADVTMTVKADPAKLTDPQSKAIAQGPITLHIEGKSGGSVSDPDVDMSMALQGGGQNLTFGFRTVDKKAWLQFMDKWYAVPPSKTKSVTSATGGGDPQKALTDLGIDPAAWASSSEVTGTEQLDGATVYHIVTKADTKQIMADVMKMLNDPALMKAAGSDASTLEQLKSQNSKQLKELEDSLTTASAEYWVDTASYYIRKAKLDAAMTFTGDIASQGLRGATFAVAVGLGGFGETVSVTPPAKALPFKQLTNGLFNMAPSGLGSGATGL